MPPSSAKAECKKPRTIAKEIIHRLVVFDNIVTKRPTTARERQTTERRTSAMLILRKRAGSQASALDKAEARGKS